MFIFGRYAAKDLPTHPSCKNKHITKSFKCGTLRMCDLIEFHKQFYNNKTYESQNAFVYKYIETIPVKRRRPKTGEHSSKTFQTKFFVRSSNGKNVPVCQKAFLNILHISRKRVETISKSLAKTGNTVKETRGGDRKSSKYKPKKDSIIKFISSIHGIESHYCRSKTKKRMYLSSKLSVNKLFQMYDSQVEAEDLKTTRSFFRYVFNTSFNLGFKMPSKDMCSVCMQLTERINREPDVSKRNVLLIEKRVHKLRAKSFFSLLREAPNNVLVLSFDMQKNQCLPQIPDQDAYYCRQLYFHTFAIVQGTSKCKLTKDNVFCYVWTEDQQAKGSNQIASALYDRLNNTDFCGYDSVKLFCDGCGGQNKNRNLVGMCSKWLVEKAPATVKDIELIFPVRGHSFIPPDRVFGLIENDIKRRQEIVSPETYVDLVESHASVIRLGQDCPVYDWKQSTDDQIKKTTAWHFKFSAAKRISLSRSIRHPGEVSVRGEVSYRSNVNKARLITKKEGSFQLLNPEVIPSNNIKSISKAKLTDVDKLLKVHFGNDWKGVPELGYYKEVFQRAENVELPDVECCNTDLICEQFDDDPEPGQSLSV